MTSKGKEIYNTIKRSLGSSSFGVASSSSGSGGVRYSGGTTGSKQWIHPPDILLNGRVEYSVKMLGVTEVNEPKGTHVIREAIHAIRFQLQVSRSVTGHSGAKLKKVDLQINVDGVTVVENKTKMVLHKYPLHRISFCADDKQDKRVFSFIAKAENSQRHDCFVFLSEKLAEQITLTVGEAFDLAYQKFLENNGRELENKKLLIVLRKRIAELETENNELKQKLAAALIKNQMNGDAPPPLLPTSPVPNAPPPGLASCPLADLAPGIVPPPPNSRRHKVLTASTAAIMAELSDSMPKVGRKLENLQIDQMESLFDDEFDPRADERKKAEERRVKDEFGLDPFGDTFMNDDLSNENSRDTKVSSVEREPHEPTPEQFERMLSMVDKRLAEMRDGFATGCLAVGDTGDSARDFDNIYSLPLQSPGTENIPSTSRVSNGRS
uniref:PID domain-containing protein n=1 Tax=Parascaris univalens TaxID=6257 RepID=A0A915BKL3_PARUN